MVRYYHVVEAAFGTPPPNDPNTTVGPPGAVNLGGWTRLSGNLSLACNGLKDYSGKRVAVNKSSGQADPGDATLVLDGDNGWLDPTNPYSPYRGYLVTGCPVRVRATDGTGVYEDSWRGYVKLWPQSPGFKPGQSAVVGCYDALGWLGSAKALYATEMDKVISDLAPSSHWPHDDIGTAVTRDAVSGFSATLSGTAGISGPSLTPEGVGSSGVFPAQVNALASPSPLAMPAPPFTVSLLVKVYATTNGSTGFAILFQTAGSTGAGNVTTAVITSQGVGVLSVTGGVSTQRQAFWDGASGATLLATGGPYLLTLTYDAAGTLSAFVDGFLTQRTTGTFIPLGTLNLMQWGYAASISAGTGQGADISHVAVWPRILTGAELLLLQAAMSSRSGELSGARINYLLDRVGWPAGLRSIAPGLMPLGPVDLAGIQTAGNPKGNTSMLDLLRAAVEYEDGVLAGTADGKIGFWQRSGRPAPSFAFGGTAAPMQEPAYSQAEATVITSATVGKPPIIYNAGQVLHNGLQLDLSKQNYVTPDDAWLVGQRVCQLGSSPRSGIDTVVLDPVVTPVALGLDLAAVGTVARHPIWLPPGAADLVEPYQVTEVVDASGTGKQLTRTLSLLAPRPTQWRLNCTAANPTGAQAAWLPRFDPVGAIVVEVLFRAAVWSNPAVETLVAHGNPQFAGTGWAFWFVPQSFGFSWADSGGVFHFVTGGVPVSRAGTRYLWAKVIFDPAVGAAFYLSWQNRETYVLWGASFPGASTVKATATPLCVGQLGSGGGQQLAGDVLQMYVSDASVTPNIPVATMDPTADDQAGGAAWTSSTGENWTLQGTGALIVS